MSAATDAARGTGGAGHRSGTGPWAGAAAAAAYAVLAHVPFPGGGWVPAAAAVLASMAFPRMAASLCVAACFVQDATGLVPDAGRAAIVGCGLVHLATGGARDLWRSGRWIRACVAMALLAIGAGASVSLAGWMGWGPEQSPSRPWALVAAADAAMVLLGASIGASAVRDAGALRRVGGAACVGLAVVFARIAGQAMLGPVTGFSQVGAVSIAAADQLTGKTGSGVVRYVGSMLTPNAMCMAVAFAVLLAWPRLGRGRVPLGVAAAGLAVAAAVLAGSKSSLIVALAMMLVLPGPVAGGVLLAAVAAWFWLHPEFRAWSGARFRADAVVFDAAGSAPVRTAIPSVPSAAGAPAAPAAPARTVRSASYAADRDGLRAFDALLGLGLSHWPVFYKKTIGRPMADPHSAIYSYPWTYGLAGIAALGTVVAGLLRALRDPAAPRGIALVLLATLLLRDMFAIPLLIGTTALTLLLWILLARVLARPDGEVRA